MDLVIIILGILIAYLIGSIPTAVWFGKLYHNVDIRQHGSRNPGATNNFRVLGRRAGTIVLLIDVLKGLGAASLPVILFRMQLIPEHTLVDYKLAFGVAAVVGHLFPIFIKFKGGKGVATLMGMMLAIHYEVALLSAVVFVVFLLLTKYVSLSSILGALSFPFMLIVIPRFRGGEPILVIFGFILFAIILMTHNKNIQRMLRGEESKTYLFKKK